MNPFTVITYNPRFFGETAVVTARQALPLAEFKTKLPHWVKKSTQLPNHKEAHLLARLIQGSRIKFEASLDMELRGPQYVDDHERLALIAQELPRFAFDGTQTIYCGFNEIWGRSGLDILRRSPLAQGASLLYGPFANGISDIFPIIAGDNLTLASLMFLSLNPTIRFMAQYNLKNGNTNFGPFQSLFEKGKARACKSVQDKKFYGAGLAALAQNVESCEFVPFKRKGLGLEEYTDKGFLLSTQTLPDGRKICIAYTHLSVSTGNEVEDIAIRKIEYEQILQAVTNCPYPTIIMGDLNIAEGSKEYESLQERMKQHGFRNAYREIHKNFSLDNDHTYDDELHYPLPLGLEGASPIPREILDFAFVRGLQVLNARVVKKETFHPKYPKGPLSDHYGLSVLLN